MSTTASEPESHERIVVGVDGSASAHVALIWAVRQAELSGAPLTVLTTWEYPTNYGYPVAWPEDLDFAADAKTVLEAAVEEVRNAHPEIVITATVAEGHPSLVLVDESTSAGLVVVGSRGHGEFAGMLLGSVSEFVATHAHCPVVIVRGVEEAKPAS